MNRRALLGRFGIAAAGLLPFGHAHAQTPPSPRKPDADKPFAEHFLVLQLSESDPKRQRLVLSVASNILKFYGQDKVAIEVVAFGPGITLLFEESEFRPLVDSLISQGVKFDVCGNTLDTVERETGKRPKTNPNAKEVGTGVAQLMSLTESGYTLVRP
jgi:intracellular sulfur oxidation DsrE/DsrF family protein